MVSGYDTILIQVVVTAAAAAVAVGISSRLTTIL
jgi:hypothetical protein